jgi:hypothetical protein
MRIGMKNGVLAPGRARVEDRTLREDRWWIQPALTVAGLGLFLLYGLVRALFIDKWYWAGQYHYLAPFYSPCLSQSCVPGSSHFLGQPFPQLPAWMSPAMIILILPGGFRFTCYYYRKAYYRSFWLSPPACAVAEPHRRYTGESRLPMLGQNVHRWFFYAAILVASVLTYDTVIAFHGVDGGIGVGLGTLLMVANVVLIWGYTFGCHSCRNIVGGRLNHFSRHPWRYRAWTLVSRLNAKHQEWAWASLFSVMIVDLYVMLVAAGAFADPRLFN